MSDAWLDPAIASALILESPDIIATFDVDGRFLEVNPATLRQTGYSQEELRQLPVASFFAHGDLMRLAAARERTAEGEQVSVTVRYRRKDGVERWLTARTMPLVRQGVSSGMVVLARDVTDEIQRTQALRQSDERFRSLVSAFDRAFFVVDPDLRVAGLFGRWIQTAGLEPRFYLGRTPAEFLPETGGEPHTTALMSVLDGKDVTYEWTYVRPQDGEGRRLRISASPMRDVQGAVIGIAGVAADITRRLLAEAEAEALRTRLAASQRIEALGRLVSGVAHELNNPLAAILNFAEELILSEPDAERRSALEVIRAQALRSRTIVRDLLAFAGRGGHRPRVPLAPGPLLESAVRAIRPLLPRRVTLETAIVDGDTSVELDRAGFEQVVTNLLSNAAQAATRDGVVRLDSRRNASWFEIRVTDDGAGIPADVLPRLFEPFFTTKPTGHGVGLGLSVSLGIVQELGGTLHAENLSGADGPGARFTVRLPVSSRPLAMLTPPLGIPVVAPAASGPKPVLLIIDDEEPIRRALRRFFERRGWEVEDSGDGAEGVTRLTAPGAESRYAAVLCDLKMPGLDGPQLYEEVRTRASALLSRIIIVTGDVTGDEAAAFLKGVSSPVLEKPFELAAVAELVEAVSGRWKGEGGR